MRARMRIGSQFGRLVMVGTATVFVGGMTLAAPERLWDDSCDGRLPAAAEERTDETRAGPGVEENDATIGGIGAEILVRHAGTQVICGHPGSELVNGDPEQAAGGARPAMVVAAAEEEDETEDEGEEGETGDSDEDEGGSEGDSESGDDDGDQDQVASAVVVSHRVAEHTNVFPVRPAADDDQSEDEEQGEDDDSESEEEDGEGDNGEEEETTLIALLDSTFV